ncbi:MAG TPA: HNH endonuclease, partial [Ilumatobacteraceae bacterium]|nr:HNH endonuclease [Ilumatobacteraceae bacterium]
MEIAGVVERVERISTVRATPAADAATVQSGLVAVREARAWLDAQHAGLVAQLRAVSSFPEAAIAAADRSSIGAATKTTERSETLAATPKLADALGDGAITAGHIDAVTRSSKQLDPSQREELLERADALVAVAAAGTVEEFRRRLDLEAKRLQADDGMERLARQRRNTRLSTWVDDDGMWNLR